MGSIKLDPVDVVSMKAAEPLSAKGEACGYDAVVEVQRLRAALSVATKKLQDVVSYIQKRADEQGLVCRQQGDHTERWLRSSGAFNALHGVANEVGFFITGPAIQEPAIAAEAARIRALEEVAETALEINEHCGIASTALWGILQDKLTALAALDAAAKP